MKPGRLLSLWAPVVAYLALIFSVSAQPSVPGAEYVWDKALHVVGYAPLAFFALRASHGGIAAPRRGPSFAAGGLVAAWAVFDEVHQSFVPGRVPSVGDVAADLAGFALTLLGMWIFFAARRQRSRSASADRTL